MKRALIHLNFFFFDFDRDVLLIYNSLPVAKYYLVSYTSFIPYSTFIHTYFLVYLFLIFKEEYFSCRLKKVITVSWII